MSAPRRQRLLQRRRGKGVVHQHFRAVFDADLGDPGDIGDRQQRVGRGLHPDQPGLRRDRRAHRVEIGQRDRGVHHAPCAEDLVDQPERAAVGVVGNHHVIAGTQHRPQRTVARRHAGTERATEAAVLDGGQCGLQRGPGRVAGAGVLESAAQAADAVLGEGAAGVDRRVDRTGRRVGPVAGVDGLGGQPGAPGCPLVDPQCPSLSAHREMQPSRSGRSSHVGALRNVCRTTDRRRHQDHWVST